MNHMRTLIKGVVCGVQVEEIEEPTIQEIRYLDKLIDELEKAADKPFKVDTFPVNMSGFSGLPCRVIAEV
ncbi:hypothetical protein B0H69_003232 [Clostridium beijerinckii]|jgi:Uncharacterized protein conserved in bacteria|uniref:Uncharacterized protein n=1 Tax=Clostridium beijerinckii (strain ATCC 51743 / NCIMB 8052) TaxID=290402 RepID=A6LZF3_CLOB8|nr:conserved hypothetical protein [Clostridium beijerinckii NCIMB 8052]AIU01417.1 hypothetical protein Cbs_3613 [Clostridium beijerinckii ATCC 35702]MBN7573390.1 DUF2200 family protein [Clostridium beijerinckii]MBN7578728.1 DUF2200 family protein [Clostridium beijerinckii]MBN7583163.1 DUF2200 family protein [Clostridium beijerinckii]